MKKEKLLYLKGKGMDTCSEMKEILLMEGKNTRCVKQEEEQCKWRRLLLFRVRKEKAKMKRIQKCRTRPLQICSERVMKWTDEGAMYKSLCLVSDMREEH
jgi:hypothetical protein